MGKRLFDILCSAFGLLLFAPLMTIIAIAIKCDSAGSVIYGQTRVGLFGRPFTIYKFRSMTMNAEGAHVTVSGDSRVTRIGRVLRRSKIDEVPQLFNVLRGDMSLVGPRPEVPRFIEYYTPQQREVMLSVRPGITDFASIEMRDEEGILAKYPDHEKAYIEVVMPQKIALYEKYVRERSMVLDIKLIFRTFSAIVF